MRYFTAAIAEPSAAAYNPHVPFQPHQSIEWAIEAWGLRDNYLKRRKPTRAPGFTQSMIEVAVVVISFELVRNIEINLKRGVERQLLRAHGASWWTALPKTVRRSAEARHHWAALQLGHKRAGKLVDIHWLSLGDLIRTLKTLTLSEWQACVSSESRRRPAFERCLLKVKRFRDHELAHPKPRPITTHQFRTMCNAVRDLPSILCPSEWDRLLSLLSTLEQRPKAEQEELVNAIDFYRREKAVLLRRWLACPILEPPAHCKHVTRLSATSITWRLKVLTLCVAADASRSVFFSFGTPFSA